MIFCRDELEAQCMTSEAGWRDVYRTHTLFCRWTATLWVKRRNCTTL